MANSKLLKNNTLVLERFRKALPLAFFASLAFGPVEAQDNFLAVAELRAELRAQRTAVLSSEMAGRIENLPIFEGQSVSKGDLLLAFDCSIQKAQLEKANTQLAVAENNLKASQQMAEYNAIGAVELANSALEVQKAKADINYMLATLERCNIWAPYDGSIGDIEVRSNEFIAAGTPSVEIFDDKRLQLEFIVPSRWVIWLQPGYTFEVFLEDTGLSYSASVTRLAAKIDAMSQSIKVVASIVGDHPSLLPGMSGRVRIKQP